LFLLVIILAWVGKATFEKYLIWSQAKTALSDVEKKIQAEESKKEKLEKEKEETQNEEYLKRIIKERLNLVEPGEKVIYILPEGEKSSEENKVDEKTLWEKFQSIFTKKEENKK